MTSRLHYPGQGPYDDDIITEDEHPPLLMSEPERELMAQLTYVNALANDVPVGRALKKLVYYSASHFNALRDAHPNEVPHFKGARLQEMYLSGFNFAGANFGGAQIDRATFLNCDLRGAQFEGAVGKPANIMGCQTDQGPSVEEELVATSNQLTRIIG